jgi:hypothetical protein
MFGAAVYVPREDMSSKVNVPMFHAGGATTPLDWRWGRLGDVAYRAVDDTVKGQLANEIEKIVGGVKDCVTGGPLDKFTICGVQDALNAFVAHLRSGGITVLQEAIHRPAR